MHGDVERAGAASSLSLPRAGSGSKPRGVVCVRGSPGNGGCDENLQTHMLSASLSR